MRNSLTIPSPMGLLGDSQLAKMRQKENNSRQPRSPYRGSTKCDTVLSGTLDSRGQNNVSGLSAPETQVKTLKADETPYFGAEIDDFDALLEESLSSDEETLNRIDPLNKRTYALCTAANDTKPLVKYGLDKVSFNYDEKQKFGKVESAMNCFEDDSNQTYVTK